MSSPAKAGEISTELQEAFVARGFELTGDRPGTLWFKPPLGDIVSIHCEEELNNDIPRIERSFLASEFIPVSRDGEIVLTTEDYRSNPSMGALFGRGEYVLRDGIWTPNLTEEQQTEHDLYMRAFDLLTENTKKMSLGDTEIDLVQTEAEAKAILDAAGILKDLEDCIARERAQLELEEMFGTDEHFDLARYERIMGIMNGLRSRHIVDPPFQFFTY